MKLSDFVPSSGLLPVKQRCWEWCGKVPEVIFFSAPLQHKVMLPPGLWLSPQGFKVIFSATWCSTLATMEQSWVFGYMVRRLWLLTSGINSPWYFFIFGDKSINIVGVFFPRANEQMGFEEFYQAMGTQFWKVDSGDGAMLWLCLGRQAGARQHSPALARTAVVQLVCAWRDKAQPGPDSEHRWQAVKHRKQDVVEVIQQNTIWLTMLRSASEVNRQQPRQSWKLLEIK